MACTESLRTQSYFDGALDKDATRDAERHIETCSECKALLSDLEAMRATIKDSATRYRADASLRERVLSSLDREDGIPPRAPWFALNARQFWAGATSGAVAMAAAALVALYILVPSDADEVIADVSAAHQRSLIGAHLTDVSLIEPGEVKTWLARHGELAPPVGDFPAQGYRLIGARADYVYEGGAGVAVYRHGNHVVNVFAWKTDDEDVDLPQSASSGGNNIVFWTKGDVVYCAVSNIPMDQLKAFASLVRSA